MESKQSSSHDFRIGLTRFFVPHPSFNWYIRTVGLGALATGAFFAVSGWFYHQALFDALGLSEILTQLEMSDAVGRYYRTSLVIGVVVTFASTIFVVVISSYVFHRIVGPVYRLQQHMNAIIDGAQPTELHFRASDQLQDVRETFNALMAKLEVLEHKPLEEVGASDLGDSPPD